MRAVDTNVVVRLATRDDARQVVAAEAFVAPGAWVSQVVLVEAVWVLSSVYGLRPSAIVTAVEILLNSYELACGMYLDGKLDQDRFKRQYYLEVRRLMEDAGGEYESRLGKDISPYKAFRKVYRLWTDPEDAAKK